ncbi:MAG: hypothetical protein HYS74_01355 [Parcubacteria group bacterium]|nr:hypothetical protein [Parcubacteria group bacterium]
MAYYDIPDESIQKNIVAWALLLIALLILGWFLLMRNAAPVPHPDGSDFTRNEKQMILREINLRDRTQVTLSRTEKQRVLNSIPAQ